MLATSNSSGKEVRWFVVGMDLVLPVTGHTKELFHVSKGSIHVVNGAASSFMSREEFDEKYTYSGDSVSE
jgi:hypothetical protein